MSFSSSITATRTGHFEIGALLALKDEWQKVDQLRILMGNEVSARTKDAFVRSLKEVKQHLDQSIEREKEKNDFLVGVPAVVEGIRSGRSHPASTARTSFTPRHTSRTPA